jgi:hypothetical protein
MKRVAKWAGWCLLFLCFIPLSTPPICYLMARGWISYETYVIMVYPQSRVMEHAPICIWLPWMALNKYCHDHGVWDRADIKYGGRRPFKQYWDGWL